VADPVAPGVRTTKTLRDYVQHDSVCEKSERFKGDERYSLRTPRREKVGEVIREWEQHVCGLSGYNPMLGDAPCPGCAQKLPLMRPAICTCGLDALLALPEGRDQPQGKESE
jgi:hypothetical protein